MTFAEPWLLLGLLAVPLIVIAYLLVQRRRARYVVRFTNVDLLANLVPRTPAWRRHVPPALYVLAMSALVISLARPTATVAVPREDATIILAMDVSGSMLATDVEPSRLASARQAASDFVDQLPPTFQVGLVTFSTSARVAVSPTTDREALHTAIDGLAAEGGTALGDAIAESTELAKGVIDRDMAAADASPAPSVSPSDQPLVGPSASPSTSPSASPESTEPPLVATVLLSDGANSTGQMEPGEAAREAADAGVPVYTIALGTPSGVVTVPNEFGIPQQIEVPPDTDTLAAIAETTGARSFEAPTATDLQAIYESLGSRVGTRQESQEVTQWFAAAGLALMLVGAGLAAHWFNRFP